MAIVNNEQVKSIVVSDIFATNLPDGVKSVLDPTQDAWAFGAPPDMGDYKVKWILSAKDAIKLYANEDGNKHYSINMEGKVLEGLTSNGKTISDCEGVTVYSTVSTRLGRGKAISTAAGFIVKSGFKLKAEMSDLEVARLVVKVLVKEVPLWVRMDWQGWSKEDTKIVFNSQQDFPDGEVGKQHQVTITTSKGQREVITASLKVKEWYGKEKPQHGSSSNSTTPFDLVDNTSDAKPMRKASVSDDDLDLA